jgi:hypothetical protein
MLRMEHAEQRTRLRIDAGGIGAFAVLVAVLAVAVLPLRAAPAADHRVELQASLAQRYRLTVIGPGFMGITGGQGTIRKPGGTAELRRDGFVGSAPAKLELPAGNCTFTIRLAGYKDWQRQVQILGGSQIHLHAALAK